jgi:hypothetical protein
MKHPSFLRIFGLLFILALACRSITITFLPTSTVESPPKRPTESLPPTQLTHSSPIASTTIPASGTGSTLGCSDQQPAFITTFDVFQPPDIEEPQARVPYRDLVFGTCVIRVTDRTHDLAGGDASTGLKNEYSRVQSFNADGSRILVRSIEANWYLYDASTLQPLDELAIDSAVDPRWDASNPNILFYSPDTRLMMYNILTQESKLVHDFSEDFPRQDLVAVWMRYEGSPSRDGRYLGLMAENQDWLTIAYLVYDTVDKVVVAKREIPPAEIDSVTISPSGKYYIAQLDNYCEPGQMGSDANPCGLMVYDRDLQNGRSLLRIVGHSDLGFNSQGREVFVFQNIDTDNISMLDLENGQVTDLWPIDFSYTSIGLHISGQAFDQPGWAVVSTYDEDKASHTWMDDGIFLMELKPEGRIVRLAHTHSVVDSQMAHDYWAEPQASANRNLTRILFTTNWNRSGTGEVEMFMIILPADWLTLLP